MNSRPRLNFTEGTIIFYHSSNNKAVNICFKQPVHRFFSKNKTRKIWKVGYRGSAAVTASSRVREIIKKKSTHGLVSKHEHCRK